MKEKSDTSPVSQESDHDILRWNVVDTELVADCEVFYVHKTHAESRCAQKVKGGFHTIVCSNWVNVIAITDDNKVVMVEQYRHGIRELTLEIPGGCIDQSDADPEAAGMRELLEETGYTAENWTLLCKTHPNPALQNNVCYTFLAKGAKKIEEPKFDESGTERLHCSLVALDEIDELIQQGKITHSLVVVGFHFLEKYKKASG